MLTVTSPAAATDSPAQEPKTPEASHSRDNPAASDPLPFLELDLDRIGICLSGGPGVLIRFDRKDNPVTPYTREAFADWLRTLPPDKPFCPLHRCPIAQSPLGLPLCENAEYGFARNGAARDADLELTVRIDHFDTWSRITPRQILLIISELEAEHANRA